MIGAGRRLRPGRRTGLRGSIGTTSPRSGSQRNSGRTMTYHEDHQVDTFIMFLMRGA